MKTRILILFFSLLSMQLSAQQYHFLITRKGYNDLNKYYELGTKALKEGNYRLADSLLKISVDIKAYPNNLFNYSLARFCLGDTVTFCENMRDLSLLGEKGATKMYYTYCATADTVYYNKKHQRQLTKRKARFTKVTVSDRYLPYKMVYIHDKRRIGETGIAPSYNFTKFVYKDYDAVYEAHKNGDTIYTYTSHRPTMIGGDDVFSKYNDCSNPLIKKVKERLNLGKVYAEVDLIIGKQGNIIHDTINETNVPKKIYAEFQKAIDTIVKNTPKLKPAKYRKKPVVYDDIVKLFFY